jgi:DNA polymerase-4
MGKKAIHEKSLLSAELDNIPEGKKYFGVLQTNLFDALTADLDNHRREEKFFSEYNPYSVYDRNRIEGIIQKHPAVQEIFRIPRDVIKAQIKVETDLTATAGVSFNKFLAKVASGYQKPDGLTVLTPKNYEIFLAQLKIDKFYGIGKVTTEKMNKYKIFNGADLLLWPEEDLIRIFGIKSGSYYYQIARGIDDREVHNNHLRKSIGAENTFELNLIKIDDLKLEIIQIAKTVSRRAQKTNTKGRTITLKIKYFDFVVQTRSITIENFTNDENEIFQHCLDLLIQQYPLKQIRLLGISLSNLDNDLEQNKPITIKNYLQLKLNLDSLT